MSPTRQSNPGDPQGHNWYPSERQLSNPSDLERAIRQVLLQQYNLEAQVRKLEAALAAKGTDAKVGAPAGSGPTDSMLLGLHVAPIDTRTLPDGAKLQWSKATGQFVFV